MEFATMTSKPGGNLTHSLVPEVRQQEERLLAELERARSEVARLKAEAEQTADARVSEARKNLPGLTEQIQRQGREDVQSALREEELTGREDIARLEGTAQHNLPDAVKHILSLVLPGDKA
jgi:regulator of protease activity HflC (stomatin/prohibitin superfamily)